MYTYTLILFREFYIWYPKKNIYVFLYLGNHRDHLPWKLKTNPSPETRLCQISLVTGCHPHPSHLFSLGPDTISFHRVTVAIRCLTVPERWLVPLKSTRMSEVLLLFVESKSRWGKTGYKRYLNPVQRLTTGTERVLKETPPCPI